ncbi:MAG: PAS domain S-box protein, partial [Candidatus Hodarchaeota archaeon]
MSRVLFVDDDKDLLILARMFLERETAIFELITTDSPYIALQKLTSEKFDAIVSDYQMPGMDGLELLQKLRGRGVEIPFIIFTGKGREEVAMQALNLGADYYLMKGGETRSLFGELAHIINRVVEHQKTETALQESEEKFRTIFHGANDMILVVKLQDVNTPSIIIEANETACQQLGFKREDLVGKAPHDLMPPWMYEKLQQAGIVEQYRSGIPLTFDGILQAKNGVEIPVEISTQVIDLGDQKLQVSIGRDITERKLAGEKLKRRESQLAEAQRIARLGSWEWNIKGNQTTWSDEMYHIFRVDPSSYEVDSHEAFLDCVYPEDRELIEKALKLTLNEQAPFSVEYRIVWPNGELRHILDRGKVILDKKGKAIGMLGTSQDITERLQVEKRLRENEQTARAILNASTDSMILLDTEGNIIATNEAQAQDLGKSVEKLIGKCVYDFFPPEVGKLRKKRMVETIHSRKPVRYEDEREGRIFDNHIYPIFDITGEVSKAAVFARDITKQKQAELALRESEERFRITFENAAIGMSIVDLKGCFVKANSAFQKLFGYSEEELRQLAIRSVLHPDEDPMELDYFQKLANGELDRYQRDLQLLRKDGSAIWGNIVTSLVRDAQDQPQFGIGMIEEISVRK